MKRVNNRKQIYLTLIIILLISLISSISYVLYNKPRTFLQMPHSVVITSLQHRAEEGLMEIDQYDTNSIVSILDKCSIKKTLAISKNPIDYDGIEFNIILYDGEKLWHVRIGEKYQCDQGYGTNIYKLIYEGDINKDLTQALEQYYPNNRK